MARVIEFEGRRIEVPDDASDVEVEEILSAQPAAAPAAAPIAPSAPVASVSKTAQFAGPAGGEDGRFSLLGYDMEAMPRAAPDPVQRSGGNSYVGDTALIATQEGRKGMSSLLGLPVDAMNAAPMLANLIPGVDGVGPISDKPLLGSEMIDDIMTGYGAIKPAPEPQDTLQRVVGRAAREVGSAIPIIGTSGVMAARGVDAVRQMNPIARTFAEPMAVAPAETVGKEVAYAMASGMGAGLANEAVGNPQEGDNFWSDFFGSMGGAGALGLASGVVKAGGNLLGAATGSSRFVDDVAGEEVALRLAANSSDLAEQFATNGGRPVDARGLADKLRTPAPVEQIIPGYQANIGDRSGDAGLATFAYNQDGASPGAANVRRAANAQAVDQRIEGLDPGGDPAQFRAALDASRDARIADATGQVDVARLLFEDQAQQVIPTMADATARGSSGRAALADRYAQEQARVTEAYRPINEAQIPVDIAPLAQRFEETTSALPLNDQQRFVPSEARVPGALVEPAVPATESSILGPDGRPVMKPAIPARGEAPLTEVTSIRSGLTDDIRTARAGGERQKARVADQYKQGVDEFVEAALPPELRQQLDTARDTRRDVADRFERPGTGIANTLQPREGGGYRLDDSAVMGQFVQPDSGRVTDFRAMMKEAGQDPRARNAVTDEVLSRVQRAGLIEKPEALKKYLGENSIVLSEFPGLRNKLLSAGAAREALTGAERMATETTAKLTTPGKSATASYLKFGDEATLDAVRNLTSGPKPREAVKELIETAGDTPETRRNLRSALWETVKAKKSNAPGPDGEKQWSFRQISKVFDDPKTAAVADELWADKPEDLADIKEVFAALGGAESSQRMKAAGTSGSGQILKGGYDASLSATSIASRMRSVNRGQLSPGIAAIDIATSWLRNRSKQIQARAIDTIASAAVNNPDLAADLLEKFNPADFAAKRRSISQKYGVRATQLVNLLDEIEGSDDTTDAVMGDDR